MDDEPDVFGTYGYAFRCSVCNELVAVDDVRAHSIEERAKPTWEGHMVLVRVDREQEG